jgi:FtsP/CotA-like multicopper oxidase with cupredoxin domain
MPHRRRTLAWVLMIGWVAAGCGADAGQEPSADPTTTTTNATTSTAAASTSTSEATTTTAGFAGTLIEVRVSGGKVETAERRVRVDRGERVRIQVEADVTDEVHVHGYDLKRPVGSGKPATIEFAADLPGIYEVELEGAKRKLVDLEVR